MSFHKENLDLVLVPSGLLVMFGYHLWLLYRCLNCPHTTTIGFENNDKKAWVDKIMKMENNDFAVPLNVLSYNISSSNFMSSICLTLCAVIGTLVANSSSVFQSKFIYGDANSSTISIKHISLLVCFLLAFACFIESTRSLIHATYLISMPNSNVPIKSIELAVIRGGDFWSLGLRALYLALLLLLWLLGPIPMFTTSIMMVCVLYFLDNNTVPLHVHQSTKSMEIGRKVAEILPNSRE
ncbi:uncharacterized protein LOC111894997 [Lactuca sativa]|uniref:uncharacterized protein LOC111894997 n=1 Tax=Lactuca sativa TaxID=4236 RepID=UPI000CD92F1B|nr:uncharacterized protein LOC111894997 [Lactuca sativa]